MHPCSPLQSAARHNFIQLFRCYQSFSSLVLLKGLQGYNKAHLGWALHKDHEWRRLLGGALHCWHCTGQLSMTHGHQNTSNSCKRSTAAVLVLQTETTLWQSSISQ